jgi:hypothetical protein
MTKRLGTRLALAWALALGAGGLALSPAWADISGPVTGDAVQDGNNEVDGGQEAAIEGGDASAGSNIVGSAQQGDAAISVTNRSVGAEAKSGDLESSNSISDVHVGERTEAPAVEESEPDLVAEPPGPPGPIGPVGPVGPGDVPSESWWGTDYAGEDSTEPSASFEDPVDSPADQPVAAGAEAPMGMVLVAELGPAANDRQVFGQVTGPPGPLGPPDLEGTPLVTPSGDIVVPTPGTATPAPTKAPQVEEREEEGLPVNGANVLRLGAFGLALLLLGLVLSASARFARTAPA